MNYIKIINTAWELREQGIISVHEHDLYTYLVHKCNKLNWKNPFNQSTEIICAVLGISRNGLVTRRNKLRQFGLITFKEGSAKRKPAEYTITCIQKNTVDDTLPDTLPDTLGDTNTINHTKQNKTNEEKVEKEKKQLWKKPTFEQITLYCNERQNGIDVSLFYDYYEAKGWAVGKSKMKDWQAAIRTWERRKKKPTEHNFVNHIKPDSYEIF